MKARLYFIGLPGLVYRPSLRECLRLNRGVLVKAEPPDVSQDVGVRFALLGRVREFGPAGPGLGPAPARPLTSAPRLAGCPAGLRRTGRRRSRRQGGRRPGRLGMPPPLRSRPPAPRLRSSRSVVAGGGRAAAGRPPAGGARRRGWRSAALFGGAAALPAAGGRAAGLGRRAARRSLAAGGPLGPGLRPGFFEAAPPHGGVSDGRVSDLPGRPRFGPEGAPVPGVPPLLRRRGRRRGGWESGPAARSPPGALVPAPAGPGVPSSSAASGRPGSRVSSCPCRGR